MEEMAGVADSSTTATIEARKLSMVSVLLQVLTFIQISRFMAPARQACLQCRLPRTNLPSP